MSKRFALLVCFLIKESTILGASLICLVLAVLGLLLFPFAWLSMKCAASHSHHGYTHAAYVRFAIEMVNVVSDQLGVLFVLMLNSSSMYQVFVTLYRNVVLGSTNVSIKDLETKMAQLTNIIFNLLIAAIAGDPYYQLTISTALSLGSLLIQMSQEQLLFEVISSGLRDLNENRLSAFETALLWTKIMESFLDDDINFNWVQHFRTNEKLLPDVLNDEDPPPEKFELHKDLKKALVYKLQQRFILHPLAGKFIEQTTVQKI